MSRSIEIIEFVQQFRLNAYDFNAAERKHLSRSYPGDEMVTADKSQVRLKCIQPTTFWVAGRFISRRNLSKLVTQQNS